MTTDDCLDTTLHAGVQKDGGGALEDETRRVSPSNICAKCKIAMEIRDEQYECPSCGRIGSFIESHIVCTSQKFGSEMHGGGGFRVQSDPLSDQRSRIFETLVERREAYLHMIAAKQGLVYVTGTSLIDEKNALSSFVPSTAILVAVAQNFSEILRKSQEKGSQFTKRKNIKNEVLAVLLHKECEKTEPFAKSKIAEMMGLRTDGFSRGYELLRLQVADGNTTLDDEGAICENKVNVYYAKILGQYFEEKSHDPTYLTAPICPYLSKICFWFVRRVVNYAIKNQIGYQSQVQSKIVGAIWFAIRAMRLQITSSQLEALSCGQATGGIKKATFLKFALEIQKNKRLFSIAQRYFYPLRFQQEYLQLI